MTRGRRWPAIAALTFALGYGLLRSYWAAGGRWGYTACDPTESYDAAAYVTGCGAGQVETLSLWSGWGAVVACILLASVALAATAMRGPLIAALSWTACVVLLAVSFPAHLLFEVPAGLAGRPTDWLAIIHRVALVAGAVLLAGAAIAAGPRRCGHARPAPPRPVPARLRAWSVAACLLPVLGFTLPHLLWWMGFGMSAQELQEIRADIGHPVYMAAIVLAPAAGGLLTLGLGHRWGQQFPSWVPVLGGRRVPRMLALVPAAMVTVALVVYGCIGLWMIGSDLAAGAVTVSGLAEEWIGLLTEIVFVAWGVALGLAALGYHQVTRPRCAECDVLAGAGRT
jgi:hypothetical protein